MDFTTCFETHTKILMEGALGERLKREFLIEPDKNVALASLVYDKKAKDALRELWLEYIEIANRYELPFIATTPTRRVNQESIAKTSYNKDIIKENVSYLKEIKQYCKTSMYIGGLMGCKGDAYSAIDGLDTKESRRFHSWQANLFKKEEVDFLFAGIMPTLPEALGIALAMEEVELPYIISFMIRKNGKLLDGTSIHDAIVKIDSMVERKPMGYMTNCVHPKVLYEALSKEFNQTREVQSRFMGIQVNTSILSPEELDGSKILFSSNPQNIAREILKLEELIDLKIVGGCCGTNGSHVEEIAKNISL